uniref:Uncharacterized protein n=1 Tax=Arundo donax TaxID=35708 RepID=A0A0A9F8H1_ARUDO
MVKSALQEARLRNQVQQDN